MPETSYDVAVLEPQCLLNLTPQSRELGILPEVANQRDIDQSREIMVQAYERAFEQVSRRLGTPVRVEFERYVPDEIADSGMGGPVDGAFEFVRVVVDSGVPVDVLVSLIADGLAEAAKGLLPAREQESDRQPASRRFTASGIEAMCRQHAERLNRGLRVDRSQALTNPSKTSIANGLHGVTVGLADKELTYLIGHDGEPYAIVETTPSEIRLLSTDEWRDWYLPSDS